MSKRRNSGMSAMPLQFEHITNSMPSSWALYHALRANYHVGIIIILGKYREGNDITIIIFFDICFTRLPSPFCQPRTLGSPMFILCRVAFCRWHDAFCCLMRWGERMPYIYEQWFIIFSLCDFLESVSIEGYYIFHIFYLSRPFVSYLMLAVNIW